MKPDPSSLLAPITAEAPGGNDVRDSDTYEAVAAEIEKLTSLSGAGSPTDWGKVEALAQEILATRSKDFMLAAWLAAAWLKLHGIAGLAPGLRLNTGLIEQYWDTGFPPLKRLRGRRNGITWWLERATDWLEQSSLPPLPASQHAELQEAAKALDTALADKDPEAPPLAGLLRQIKALEVLEPPPALISPTAADPAPVAAATSADAAPAPSSAAGGLSTPAPAGESAAPPPLAATTVPSAARPAAAHSTLAPSAAVRPGDLTSLDDVIRALTPIADQLSHVGTALQALDRCHPLAIDITRFAARSTLFECPPARDGATALMAPAAPVLNAFETIGRAGNAEGLIEFCESRLTAFPFWLDLDREAARGFALLGEAGAAARRRVIRHVLDFTERLPGLVDLTFSDGTPFAGEATRQWLAQCQAEQAGGGLADAFDTTRRQAQAAVDAGHHDDALQAFQQLIRGTWSGRDRYRARLALAELLQAARPGLDLQPFATPLAEECLARDLAAWEPELAAQVWQLQARVARHALERLASPPPAGNTAATPAHQERQEQQAREALEQALRQLSTLDAIQAARLG